ncbi:MAG: DUF5106 domain-containing protein [Bacteroidales bacterium]|jgi:thiol-disulfide isomerase/thioredoxin|nr:DUF5106 domain-containing protein [Bacteroidales bacterium]
MKKRFIVLFLLVFVFFSQNNIFSQQKNSSYKSGHEIIVHIKGATDPVIYLAIHHRNQLYLRDSAKVSSKETYVFKGTNRLDEGLYTLISSKRMPYLEFLIDNNEHFELFMDTSMNPTTFTVKNSPEVEVMLAFQRKTGGAKKLSDFYLERRKINDEAVKKDSVEFYDNKLKDLNTEMETYIKDLIAKNPDYLMSKMQKVYQNIEIPDPPVKADGTIDSLFQSIYYRTHYWDNFDFTDKRMIYLPVTEPKYVDYFTKVLYYQETDTVIKYVDMFLKKAEADSLLFRYFVDRLSTEYQGNEIGYDAVFVHLVKNNHLKGKTPWIDEDYLKKYKNRVLELEKTLIGSKAPDIIMPDMQGRWISSNRLPQKYVILWFWDPTCHTCKNEAAELKHVYDSLAKIHALNFEVYAVASHKDTLLWKTTAKERDYKWICVGGHTANIDWHDAYSINAMPTMFILNENREIIMNKRIEKKMIPIFLDQYERIQAAKKRRATQSKQ